jgi:hypothetical protein
VLCLLGEDGCSRGQVILVCDAGSKRLGVGVRELVLARLGGLVSERGAQEVDMRGLVSGDLGETATDPMT